MKLLREGMLTISEPLFDGMDVVLAFDPSKTSTGLIVGNAQGEVYTDFRFDGKNSGTSIPDCIKLCCDQRAALRRIFKGANILCAGIEDIVTVKDEKGKKSFYREYVNRGMDQHEVREKLTMIFSSIIIWLYEEHKIVPNIVNNMAWKSNVIPLEFRHGTDKWSVNYLRSIGHPYAFRDGKIDDICDAYCIYQYLVKTINFNALNFIHQTESINEKTLLIYNTNDYKKVHDTILLEDNLALPIEEVIDDASNKYRLSNWFIRINPERLSYELISESQMISDFSVIPQEVYIHNGGLK